MKTKPMEHQEEGRVRLRGSPSFYGLGCEQGTGKTWMLLDDMEHQFNEGMIKAALVVAPKGVHTNWPLREIPTHLEVPVRADYFVSGAGKKRTAGYRKLIEDNDPSVLKVLAMNIDALNTKNGYALAQEFLSQHKAMMALDESSRIKNPSAQRTKNAIKLGRQAVSRRIASGTMISNSPLDVFSQFEFLAPRRALLGTTSYRAFVAEFAELMPPESGLVQNIVAKSRRGIVPQIVQRDPVTGMPRYKNLDKLRELMSPYVYRVLKSDCLDLPDKIYQTAFFELTPAQRKVYNQIRDELRYERDSGDIDRFNALTKITKLQQVTSGFIMVDGEPTTLMEKNPRMDLLREVVEDIDGQFIVWARFKEEHRQIAALFREMEIPFVEYHGSVKTADREVAVDTFQNGQARAFIGQAQSGGIGLTLTAAQTVVYFSNTFSLEERLQSEDRCHRFGTKTNVVYIDLIGTDTIDQRIVAALQSKGDVASEVMDNL